MARHETQGGEITASGLVTGVAAKSLEVPGSDWLVPAVFIIGGVAAIGLVIVALGAYLAPNAPNLAAVTAGVAIMLLAAIAWIFAAAYLIARIVKRRFTGRRPASRPGQPATEA